MNVWERIRGKKIVIWGKGRLQKDLEGMYPFLKPIYYIEKEADAKERIFAPQKLQDEKRSDLMLILCTDEWDLAVEELKSLGYTREQYFLGTELLINHLEYERILNQEIYLWGTGGSYFCREEEIRRYLPHVAGFIVTERKETSFCEKKVFSMEEARLQCRCSFIVVVSIYYEEISEGLIQMGFRQGKDFMHIDTLLTMARLSTRVHGEYQFFDRKKDAKDLLIVLAGYKEFLWENVFSRLRAYLPSNMDVCIVTSGLTNEKLKGMCENFQWSYLSTEKNQVSLAVNLAMYLHPEAEYIYKMDEDIFVTKSVFEIMKETYFRVEKESRYVVGFVAPLMPVNGYGYVRLLERFGIEHLWKERFGALKYTNGVFHHKAIHRNPDAAAFMWGEGNPSMDDLDRMQNVLKRQEFQYSVCPIRYSIGFILFHRDNWIRMEAFSVLDHMNMGIDEEHLCQFCMMNALAMVIAENAVAGHFCYGLQTKKMEEYYQAHREKFSLKEN